MTSESPLVLLLAALQGLLIYNIHRTCGRTLRLESKSFSDIPAGGVASFGSIVVKGFGYSTLYSTLLLCPLGVIQAICLLFGGWMTSRFKNIRTWLIAGCQIPALIGSVLLFTLLRSNQRGLLGSYYVVQTHGIEGTLTMSLLSSNFAGYTKKATASAMMYIAFCAGQVVAPQLFLSSEAPVYETAFRASFIYFALCIVATIVLRYYLIWENKRRDSLTLTESVPTTEGGEFLDLTHKEQKHVFRYVLCRYASGLPNLGCSFRLRCPPNTIRRMEDE